MEPEILKLLAAPSSAALMTFIILQRVNRLESRIDSLSYHLGAPRAGSNRSWKKFSVLLVFLGAFVFMSGCAHVTQEAIQADGASASSRTFAIWPATSSVEKASVKQTKTTQGIGVEGAGADGGGTNMVSALSELHGILKIISRP